MINKKGMIFFCLLIVLPLISAQIPYDGDFYFLRDGAEKVVSLVTNLLGPFFNAILGEYTGGYGDFSANEIFLIRILLLILLFILIYTGTKNVPTIKDNNAVVFIISIAVSLIAVRFMSKSEFFFGILLPYGALGVALTTMLPFIIFFFFVHAVKLGSAGRKIGWLFFAIVFISLWVSKSDQLSPTSNWIYIISIIAIAIVFVFDRAVHRYFFLHELNIFLGKTKQKSVVALQAEYMNILNVDSPQANARREEIEKQLKKMGADLP